MPKVVFIAHPISGDIETDLRRVAAICRAVHTHDQIPIFPSSVWRQHVDKGKDAQALIDGVDLEYFKQRIIDEAWFYGNYMSDEMKKEALVAHQCGITLVGKSAATRQALKEMRLPAKYDERT